MESLPLLVRVLLLLLLPLGVEGQWRRRPPPKGLPLCNSTVLFFQFPINLFNVRGLLKPNQSFQDGYSVRNFYTIYRTLQLPIDPSGLGRVARCRLHRCPRPRVIGQHCIHRVLLSVWAGVATRCQLSFELAVLLAYPTR